MKRNRKKVPAAVVNPSTGQIWVPPQTAKPNDVMTPEQVLEAERQLGIKSPWHDEAVAAIKAKEKH